MKKQGINFRDSRLANSAIGPKAIQIYYNNADSINAALDRSPALRGVARRVLEMIAPMAGKCPMIIFYRGSLSEESTSPAASPAQS